MKYQRYLSNNSKKQQFLPILKDFKSKLVEAFLAADIPLYNLKNPKICNLFTDLGQPMPSKSACRAHVVQLFEDKLRRIKERLHDKTVFLVVDESEF